MRLRHTGPAPRNPVPTRGLRFCRRFFCLPVLSDSSVKPHNTPFFLSVRCPFFARSPTFHTRALGTRRRTRFSYFLRAHISVIFQSKVSRRAHTLSVRVNPSWGFGTSTFHALVAGRFRKHGLADGSRANNAACPAVSSRALLPWSRVLILAPRRHVLGHVRGCASRVSRLLTIATSQVSFASLPRPFLASGTLSLFSLSSPATAALFSVFPPLCAKTR